MAAENLVLGNRIPYEYFITWGTGESDVSIHAGAYDDALKAANIENCNIIKYSSVMPPEARLVPMPEKMHHGCVLETILAEMFGNQGEILTAGLITWKIKQRDTGELVGGFVAEYNGHAAEVTARRNLEASMQGMNERRGYAEDRFEVFDVHLEVKSFAPVKQFGTVMVVIGFISYLYPVLDR